jgi:hypothetical protein
MVVGVLAVFAGCEDAVTDLKCPAECRLDTPRKGVIEGVA